MPNDLVMSRIPRPSGPALRALCALAAAPLLLLFPHILLGKSLVPLELLAILEPWRSHAGELWGRAPEVVNPLLDALQQYYPRRVYFTEAIREGWLPFWNPYVYGGSPFLAAQQGAVLYPLGWLLALLFPPEMQAGWSAYLHLVLAGWGGWLFLRVMGFSLTASVLGALGFALNGYVVVWLAYPNVTQWTMCWLPLACYLGERGRRDGLKYHAVEGAALGMALLGGHGQSSAYVLIAWGMWSLLRSWRQPRPLRALGTGLLLPTALGIGLALGQLLPAADFVPRTDRAGRLPWKQVYGAGMPPMHYLTWLLPRLFGDGTIAYAHQFWLPKGNRAGLAFVERSFYPGVVVLLLAVGGLVTGFSRKAAGGSDPAEVGRRDVARYGAALTVLATLWAGATVFYWPLWWAVPGFGQFTAVSRIICLAGWGLALLAAAGLRWVETDRVEDRRRGLKVLIPAVLGLVAVIGVGLVVGAGAAPRDVTSVMLMYHRPTPGDLAAQDAVRAVAWLASPLVLLFLTLPRPDRRALAPGHAAVGVALVAALDLMAFGFGFNPAADPALARATTNEIDILKADTVPSRTVSIGSLGKALNLSERMPSNLLSVYRSGDILGSDSFVTRRYREWEAALQQAAGPDHPWSNPGAPNLRSAGVRTYLTGSKELFPGLRPLAGSALQVDDGALPYARVHGRTDWFSTDAQLLTELGRPTRFPSLAMSSWPGWSRFQSSFDPIAYTARRVNGNRIRLDGENPEPGLLVVCEQFEPGWRARVDGRIVQPGTADHMLLALPLSAGRHQVELDYLPAPIQAGLFGTLLTVAVLTAILVATSPSNKREVL